jgi:tetratricopeptide (TPR) repeat protein
MHRSIALSFLASFALFAGLPPSPADAQTAPKNPDDYPFDPPEFRIHYEATFYTDEMHKLQKQGLYKEAEPYARKALQTMSKLPGQELASAVCRMNLADLCLKLNKLEEAEFHYRLCLRSFSSPRASVKGVLNDNDPVALCLFRLAAVCRRMGRMQEAEQMCNQGLAIVETRLGKDHAQMATGLMVLADMCRDVGKLDKCEELLRSCIKIREARLGQKNPETAVTVNSLGDLYVFQRRFRDAEPVLRQCVKIRVERLGPNHPDVAESLTSLADLCHLTGRYQEAAILNQGALEIRVAKLGQNDPSVATNLENLAAALQAMGAPAEARQELLQQSRQIREAIGKKQ